MHWSASKIIGAEPTIQEPPVKAKPGVDVDLLFSIRPDLLNDSYVYVHCTFNNTYTDMLIRIWSTTFLVDRNSSAKSQLIHAENISMAPQWTLIPDHSRYTFLLIFNGLPKSTKLFDLVEEISQPGGFHISSIPRNDRDVYHVSI